MDARSREPIASADDGEGGPDAAAPDRPIASLERQLARHAGERVHVLLNPGNAGDGLIHSGGRQLFARLGLRTREMLHPTEARGRILLVFGSGAFCAASSHRIEHARHYLDRFEEVVILPSSFDPGLPQVAAFLRELPPHVTVYCRERISFDLVRPLLPADTAVRLSEDLAFSFDYGPWRARRGRGVLACFRTDGEAALPSRPLFSIDVSRYGDKNDAWPLLDVVTRFAEVHTDRTHVAIVAAMTGRPTYVYDNNYHKNRAIFEHSLARLGNVSYEGTAAPGVRPPLSDGLRMAALHVAMRARKPLVRLLAHRRRRVLRQPDPSPSA